MESGNKQHFVLLHGAGHGAWCWYKVRCRLESSGHLVSCLDLVSGGIDPTDANLVQSIAEYSKPLTDLLSALPDQDKVILVGHSAGGLSLLHAMHVFPEKIKLAIFIAATMLRSGFDSEQDFKDGFPDLSEYGEDIEEFNFGQGADNPPTSGIMTKKFQRLLLYQLSPIEDVTLASMLLRPFPAVLLKTKFEGGEKVDEVKRVFIKTKHDKTLKLEQQDTMIKRWPPSGVFELDSDHSPFFSAPQELFEVLVKASNSVV